VADKVDKSEDGLSVRQRKVGRKLRSGVRPRAVL
jgi:hypothetical protein